MLTLVVTSLDGRLGLTTTRACVLNKMGKSPLRTNLLEKDF
jgi:hypothetical protein